MLKARARFAKTLGEMNKLEVKYSELLEKKRLAGLIAVWRYEREKFKLADKTWYTPDFKIILPSGLRID